MKKRPPCSGIAPGPVHVDSGLLCDKRHDILLKPGWLLGWQHETTTSADSWPPCINDLSDFGSAKTRFSRRRPWPDSRLHQR